jgi:hypothetical protein
MGSVLADDHQNRAARAIRIMLELWLEVERAVGEVQVGVEQWKHVNGFLPAAVSLPSQALRRVFA